MRYRKLSFVVPVDGGGEVGGGGGAGGFADVGGNGDEVGGGGGGAFIPVGGMSGGEVVTVGIPFYRCGDCFGCTRISSKNVENGPISGLWGRIQRWALSAAPSSSAGH